MSTHPQSLRLFYSFLGLVFSTTAAFSANTSAVSLSSSPQPSTYGQVVTLTASVTAGATGKVTFYDGVAILGVATISGNSATFRTTLLPSGARSLRARYQGDSNFLPSTSPAITHANAAVASLGMRTPHDFTAGARSDYVVVGDFNGDLKPDVVAAGAGNGNIYALIGNGDGTFQAAKSTTYGNAINAVAVGDWNGDGKTDLVVVSTSANVLLGNGDGTFQLTSTIDSNANCFLVSVGDFNRDGKADLILTSNSGMQIALGNGDGTFQKAVSVTSASSISSQAVADFNGDGKADLIFTSYSGTLFVIPGNGDGTFGTLSQVTPYSGGYSSRATTADINGDGVADILVWNSDWSGFVQVYLGVGNATFQQLSSTTTRYAGPATAIDLTGDGKADLVYLTTYSSLGVNIATGYGDGTFQTPAFWPTAQTPESLDFADFDGDGRVDMVVGTAGNTVSVLLGGAQPDLSVALSHGNGLTQNQAGAIYKVTVSNMGEYATVGAVGAVTSLPAAVTAAAISGGGWTCTLATTTCTRSDALAPGSSYPPILVTVNVGSTTGTVTASATVSGGSDTNTANNFTTDTTNIRFTTGVTLTSSANPSTLSQDITLTATVTSGTGRVAFFDGPSQLGMATISSGQAKLVTGTLASGSHAIAARYTGDANFGPVTSAVLNQVVRSSPSNGPQPVKVSPTGVSNPAVRVVDVDADGKADVLAFGYGNGGYQVIFSKGKGDGTFGAPATIWQNTNSIQAFAVGDGNSDGKLDLFLAVSDGTLRFLAGNGDGTFQAPSTFATIQESVASRGLFALDLNRDGLSDLVALTASGVTLFPGNGDGTFAAPLLIRTTSPPSANFTVFGDLNNDGIVDFVVSDGSYSSKLYVYLGVGDGTFLPPIVRDGVGTYPNALAGGDFNGDGKLDIATLYWVAIGTRLGNGDGTMGNTLTSSMSEVPGNLMVAGDVDGDGKLDLVYGSYASTGFALARGNGDGTFVAGSRLNTSGYASDFATFDLNKDGRLDLVVAASDGTLNVYLGGSFSGLSAASSHNGRFTAGTTGSYQVVVTNPRWTTIAQTVTVVDTLPQGITATAISGSGWNCALATLTCARNDTLTVGTAYPTITINVNVASNLSPSTVNNQVSVTTGSETTTSTDPTTIVSPTTISLAVSAASAGIGQQLTLTATVTTGASGAVHFFLDGTFFGSAILANTKATLLTRALPVGAHSLGATYVGDATHGYSRASVQTVRIAAGATSGLSSPVSYSTGATPVALVTGDFNGDGITDLVTANSAGNTVSVLLGLGNGAFQSKVDYAVGTGPVAIAVGDFDGDGYPDLAVANQTANSITILGGKGDGTFRPGTTLNFIRSPKQLATTDFNLDGVLDLAIAFTDETLYILTGNGNLTFQPQVYAQGYAYGPLVVTDLNRDGRPDLLAGDYSGVYFVSNNADGTFTNSSSIGLNGTIGGIAVNNFNSDTNLDFIATDSSGRVSIGLGNGDGTFQTPASFAVNSSSGALAVGDINGDGKLDVVSTDVSANVLSVSPGDGAGNLLARVAYPTGNVPQALALGDFNGDSRTDIAVLNTGSNSIWVFTGTLTPVLGVSGIHTGNFLFSQTGATYTITVTNSGPGVVTNTVTVVDTLPAGLTATAMSGSGWSCTLATLTCTQSGPLNVAASFPPITLTVNVTTTTASTLTNLITVSSPGAISASAADPTNISALPPPVPQAPANGQLGVSLNPILSWSATTGATSYDVYFGTQNNPPLVGNTTSTTFTPGTLSVGTVYYWRIVSKNSSGTATTIVLAFMTRTQAYHAVKVGAYDSGYWILDQNGNFVWNGASVDKLIFWSLGRSGEIPVYGDWNGDGRTKIGLYIDGTWLLDYNGNGVWDGPNVDKLVYFGGQGYTPIVGDWNGSGTTKIGVHSRGTWMLDYNGNFAWDGVNVDKLLYFGGPEYTPVVGDWNGSGTTKIGVHNQGTWLLDYNGNFAWDGANVDKLIFFGGPDYTPVVGDWNGSGNTKVGAYKAGTWLLDYNGNFVWDGLVVDKLIFFGGSDYSPMVGDWNGSGTTKVGAYRAGQWVLDVNGNFVWDPPADQVIFFGGNNQLPLIGVW